ncbi:MAG: DUF4214 domain-containing protein [Clostridiales bacterium]|nr:DUF4214 domain-containing protein [Clostridiales bacterium]
MEKKRVMRQTLGLGLAAVCAIGAANLKNAVLRAADDEFDSNAFVLIDETNFPDEILREYVSAMYDEDAGGFLDDDEIAAAKELQIRDSKLESLAGIEYLTELTSIDVENHLEEEGSLTTIDLSKNTKLEKLNCYGNKLTALDVSNNTELLELDVMENYLKSLNVTKNTKLKQLYASGNQISSLDLSQNLDLEDLAVGGNSLQSLDVTKNTELLSLTADFNQLKSLDLTNNTKLQSVFISENQITELDISTLTDLVFFCADNNKLKTIDTSKCEKLESFSATENLLETVDFSKNDELTYVWLYKNELTELDFSHNGKLKSLLCMNNKLTKLNIKENKYLEDLFCGSNSLTELDLSNNTKLKKLGAQHNELNVLDIRNCAPLLKSVLNVNTIYCEGADDDGLYASYAPKTDEADYYVAFDGYTYLETGYVKITEEYFPDENLRNYIEENFDQDKDFLLSEKEIADAKVLDLGYTGVSSLAGISCLNNLEELICYPSADVKLEDQVMLGGNPKLKTLYLDGQPIEQLDLYTLPDLEDLSVNYCKLSELDLSNNKKLKSLQCAGNNLTTLDLSNNTALERLWCFENKLTALDVSMLPELEALHCGDNKLSKLDVTKNSKLVGLSAHNNKLTSIDVSKNPELATLMLTSNVISTLDVSKNLDLNSLYCDDNKLKEIDVSKNVVLTDLFCGENQLKKLDVSQNVVLTSLACNDNQLSDIDLSKNTKLVYVKCDGNKLSELDLSKNAKLQQLWCNGNEIKDLDLAACAPLLKVLADSTTKKVDKNTFFEYHYDENDNVYFAVDKTTKVFTDKFRPTATPTPTSTPTPTPVSYTIPDLKGMPYQEAKEKLEEELKKAGFKDFEINVGWDPSNYSVDMEGKITKQDPVAGTVITENGNKITLALYAGEKAPEPTKEPSFEDFVERLYTVALNRKSDPEGKEFWMDEIKNGYRTGADCAEYFLISEEFSNRKLSIDDFVETLYKTFFNRESEPTGKAYWIDQLKTNQKSREDVIRDFANSTEWCNVCATYGVKSGAKNAKAEFASKNAKDFATRLYTCCLKRDPEADGLKYWSLALTNLEQTGSTAAKFFFQSDEFKNLKTTNKEYVYRLYTTFMDREPEIDGEKFWINKLDGGMSRSEVLASFITSREFSNICAKYAIDRGDA